MKPNPTRRQGSMTLELALTLPVLLVILVGILEWGWYLSQEVTVIQAVRNAAHAGARTRQVDDPAAVALETLRSGLDFAGMDPDLASIDVSTLTSPGGDLIRIDARLPYQPLANLLPVPDRLAAQTTFRLEDQ